MSCIIQKLYRSSIESSFQSLASVDKHDLSKLNDTVTTVFNDGKWSRGCFEKIKREAIKSVVNELIFKHSAVTVLPALLADAKARLQGIEHPTPHDIKKLSEDLHLQHPCFSVAEISYMIKSQSAFHKSIHPLKAFHESINPLIDQFTRTVTDEGKIELFSSILHEARTSKQKSSAYFSQVEWRLSELIGKNEQEIQKEVYRLVFGSLPGAGMTDSQIKKALNDADPDIRLAAYRKMDAYGTVFQKVNSLSRKDAHTLNQILQSPNYEELSQDPSFMRRVNFKVLECLSIILPKLPDLAIENGNNEFYQQIHQGLERRLDQQHLPALTQKIQNAEDENYLLTIENAQSHLDSFATKLIQNVIQSRRCQNMNPIQLKAFISNDCHFPHVSMLQIMKALNGLNRIPSFGDQNQTNRSKLFACLNRISNVRAQKILNFLNDPENNHQFLDTRDIGLLLELYNCIEGYTEQSISIPINNKQQIQRLLPQRRNTANLDIDIIYKLHELKLGIILQNKDNIFLDQYMNCIGQCCNSYQQRVDNEQWDEWVKIGSKSYSDSDEAETYHLGKMTKSYASERNRSPTAQFNYNANTVTINGFTQNPTCTIPFYQEQVPVHIGQLYHINQITDDNDQLYHMLQELCSQSTFNNLIRLIIVDDFKAMAGLSENDILTFSLSPDIEKRIVTKTANTITVRTEANIIGKDNKAGWGYSAAGKEAPIPTQYRMAFEMQLTQNESEDWIPSLRNIEFEKADPVPVGEPDQIEIPSDDDRFQSSYDDYADK